MGGWTTFLDLRDGDARLLLRFRPDDGKVKALAFAAGFGLAYLDASPPTSMRDRLGELAAAFVRAGEGRSGEDDAMRAVERAVVEVFPHAKTKVLRRVPVDQRVPRWPVSMRSGEPDPKRGRLWPFDAETTGMQIGTRKLMLREWLDEVDAQADARWLESHGLVVARLGDRPESGPVALLAAFDRATIDEARKAHRDASAPSDRWQDAARRMGELLGYPRCCVEAFVRVRLRDDLSMFADLLPPIGSAPSSPLAGWLVGATTSISHAPCAADCAPTLALARSVLDALDRGSPGFCGIWERLARRVHAIDVDGRCFALDVDDDRVVDAVELVPPARGDRSFDDVVRPTPRLKGATLRVVEHRLVADVEGEERWSASLVCDQRG